MDNTSLKVSKKGKYVQIDYISGLSYTPINYWGYIWALNVNHAREFIKLFRDIESNIKEIIQRDNLPFDYRLIMLMFIKQIDSISDGLSIWSNKTSEDLSIAFVHNYADKYEKANEFCKETLEYVESEGKRSSYMKNWKRYDKYNELVREFFLPYKPLELKDFDVDEIKSMSKTIDYLNDLIDEVKKNKNE